jgi:MinD superfamily P-loop ATPase
VAACRFGAIDPGPPFRVDPVLCEGCRACALACPTAAIGMLPMTAGAWYRSTTRFGPLFHARLTPGRENSGKLVTRVREAGTARARETGADLVLIDGPPGIGCPVIAALTGADLALLVVEPTVSGAADLERALDAVDHFGVPAIVALNKADLNPRKAEEIGRFSAGRGVEIVGSLPFDDAVPRAMRAGVPVTAIERSPVGAALASLWRELSRRLEDRSNDSDLRVSGTGMATLSAGS